MPTKIANPVNLFVSYSQSDTDWTIAFVRELSKRHLFPWFAETEVKIGDSLTKAIDEGLRSSDAYILILNADNASSSNLFFELGAAVAMKKRIIPIIDPELDTSQLPVPLLHYRFLRRTSPEETAELVARAVSPG